MPVATLASAFVFQTTVRQRASPSFALSLHGARSHEGTEMETSKSLQEQIDSLAIEAKALISVAKKESRELTNEESEQFDTITKTGIPELKAKLATAINREDAIVKLSNETRRQNSVEELDTILSNSRDPRTVLPVDGRFGSDGAQQDRIYVRQAKLKAFKNERDAFNAGMWLRGLSAKMSGQEDVKALQHVRNCGLDINNTAYEYSGPQGGYLVPGPISQTLIDVRENVGVARQICDIQPMTADTLTIPKRSAGLTVYAPGEANAITTSDKTWKQVELITKKRAVASYISQELVDDALINIVDNIVSEMGYALALQEDLELINGTGAATTYFGVTGLLSSIGSAGISQAATGHDTWPELDSADFTACIGLLPERFATRSPVWVCSSNFYHTAMLHVLVAGGGNTVATLQSGSGNQRMFLGYPVYLTAQMPLSTAAATNCALFGQFDMGVILGDRGVMRFDRDPSTQFLSDLLTLKATTRYDIKVHQPGTSSVAGAYVALKTAA
jgi:HK97 family phage major capsid protein